MRIYLALLLVLGSTGSAGAQDSELAPDQLKLWKQRFLELRKQSAQIDPVYLSAIPCGLAILGEIEAGLAEAKRLHAPKDFLNSSILILDMAAVLAKVDRVEEAQGLLKHIQADALRRRGPGLIAMRQLQRGDLEDALKLAADLPQKDRDTLYSSAIEDFCLDRRFDEAQQLAGKIGKVEQRKKMAAFIIDEASIPEKSDPDFVEQRVRVAKKRRQQMREQNRELRELLKMKDQPGDAKTQEALARHTASAIHRHSLGDLAGCQKHLEQAFDEAKALKDQDLRLFESLSVGWLAHHLQQNEYARTVLREQLKNPRADESFLGLSMFRVSPIQAMIELFTAEEFEPILQRWKTADWKTEYVAFITSAAKLGRFDLLDREFKSTKDPGMRLLITISALENLASRGNVE